MLLNDRVKGHLFYLNQLTGKLWSLKKEEPGRGTDKAKEVLIQSLLARQKELELQNEALKQRQREMVNELAGGIAHHFNNILTTVLGYVDLSLDDLPADHPVADNLQVVNQAAQRAADLTYQLLAFSRQHITQPQPANLNNLIFEWQPKLRLIAGKNVDLVLRPASDLKETRLDRTHFEQLLLNLIKNAREAMPEGGQLTLKTANVELDPATGGNSLPLPPGSYICLTVADTGLGMTEEVKARIFDPFFTTKKVGDGAGLSLSMCLGLVQQHQGHITVESQPGKGSAFKLYFPCSPPECASQLAGVPAARSSESPPPLLQASPEATPETLSLSTLKARAASR